MLALNRKYQSIMVTSCARTRTRVYAHNCTGAQDGHHYHFTDDLQSMLYSNTMNRNKLMLQHAVSGRARWGQGSGRTMLPPQ